MLWLIVCTGVMVLFGVIVAQGVSEAQKKIIPPRPFTGKTGNNSVVYPATALKQADSLLTVSMKEKNIPLIVKALMDRIAAQTEISEDSLPSLIRQTGEITDRISDPVGRAMLNSLETQLYAIYFNANRYEIIQRTALTDTVPARIAEWSANLFTDRIVSLAQASLQPAELLQHTSVQTYAAALTTGEDSRVLRPTMFDFLAYRAIEIYNSLAWAPPIEFSAETMPVNGLLENAGRFVSLLVPDNRERNNLVLKVYQELLLARAHDKNSPAYLIDDLNRLNFVYENVAGGNDSLYVKSLVRLIREYGNDPYSTEVVISLLSYYQWRPLERMAGGYEGLKNAVETGRTYMARFPEYVRIGCLKNIVDRLTRPSFTVTRSKELIYPEEPGEVTVQYKNVESLTLEIERLEIPLSEASAALHNDSSAVGIPVYSKQIPVSHKYLLTESTDTLHFPPLKQGLYKLSLTADGVRSSRESQLVYVSRLFGSCHSLPGDKCRIIVTDGRSGEPLEGVEVRLYETPYYRQNKYVKSVYSDKNGLVTVDNLSKVRSYQLRTSQDSAYPTMFLPYAYSNKEAAEKTSLFTDRSVYRPGQTLYFTGILYTANRPDMQVIPGRTITVRLNDANGKEVTRRDFVTDTFGAFSGEFVLPRGKLTGAFTLVAGDTRTMIEVAEYKRPTFEVDFSPVENTYSFGKPVSIEGKAVAYSGVSLPDATVSYTVTRIPYWPWWRNGNREQVASGTVQTDSKGVFHLQFVPLKKEEDPVNAVANYQVQVTVTTRSGETQEGSMQVTVGDARLLVRVNMPEYVNKENPVPLNISVTNLMGEKVSASCRYILYSLYENRNINKLLPLDSLKIRMQQAEVSFNAAQQPAPADWRKLPSGSYRLVVQATDPQGKIVSEQADFILYGAHEKKPPVLTYQWTPVTEYTCTNGETVEILYGTSVKDAYLLYELFDGEKQLQQVRMKVSDRNVLFPVTYKESYGDVLSLLISYVKDQTVYHQQMVIRRKQPDKKLKIGVRTFRDRLQPGSQEEWSFTVRGAADQPVNARFMAEMFDASLNAILPHGWYFSPDYRPAPVYFAWGYYNSSFWTSASGRFSMSECPPFRFDRLSFPGINEGIYYAAGMPGLFRRAKGMNLTATSDEESEYTVFEEEIVPVTADAAETKKEAGPSPEEPIRLRENFDETAFFYPTLQSGENGEVSIKFTVPDANTRWQFMALAFTRELAYGQLDTTVVTSKPLMVAPNIPRFVRQGDEVSIVTTVSNTSDVHREGTLVFELFDPYTGNKIWSESKAFVLAVQESKSLPISFAVPQQTDLLGVRVTARAGDLSDGEQHLLPVLPSRVLVTETLPFTLSGTGEKTFTLSRLAAGKSDGREDYRLTLEYTDNPVWYVVQALPSLVNEESENMVKVMASFYGNTVSGAIVKANPAIASALRAWKAEGGDTTTLRSQLEKNEFLKNILLEETPWVLAAANQTERMQSLSTLLDENRIRYLQTQALDRMATLQLPGGGWSWCKGMPASPFITMKTLEGLSRLSRMNMIEYDQQGREMQMKGVKYLDQWMTDGVSRMTGKQTYKSYILYLYVRSSYRDIPLAGETLTRHKNLMSGLKEGWKELGLYEKALAAVTLYRYGFTQEARQALRSLRESATRNQDGMFWQNNRSVYSYQNGAILTHTAIMNAFAEIAPDTGELNEMKQWLLLQKQTQDWGSVPSTEDAIYAILSTGSDWLAAGEGTTIVWGDRTLKSSQGQPLSGYIESIRQGTEISPADATVKIKKNSTQPSWGALYWQFFTDFGRTEPIGVRDLKVDKMLYVQTDKGLVPLSKTGLKPGDKVTVRLVLTVGRDLGFVYLKDQRAACFEPVDQLSGYQCRQGVCYYRENRDAVTNFFFEYLPKGTYVFEYDLWLDRSGSYNNGITTVQCLYAPEITAHTQGGLLIVK